MGFPVCATNVSLPKPFIHALSFLGFIITLLFSLFSFLGLSDFLEPAEVYLQENPTTVFLHPPMSPILIREFLPIVKFSDLVAEVGCDLPENCAVCLCEFQGGEEIMWLKNCKHIFHQKCLDRWMDHDQKTCPLCRTSFVPRDLQEEFNEPLRAASGSNTSSNVIGNEPNIES